MVVDNKSVEGVVQGCPPDFILPIWLCLENTCRALPHSNDGRVAVDNNNNIITSFQPPRAVEWPHARSSTIGQVPDEHMWRFIEHHGTRDDKARRNKKHPSSRLALIGRSSLQKVQALNDTFDHLIGTWLAI